MIDINVHNIIKQYNIFQARKHDNYQKNLN